VILALEIVGVFAMIFGLGWLRAKILGKSDMDVLLGDAKPQTLFPESEHKK
jgi:hypothetical protein